MLKSGFTGSYREEPKTGIWSNELKYRDSGIVPSFIPNTGTVVQIDFPKQGITQSERVADRARLVDIERFSTFNLAPGNTNDVVRWIIFQVKGRVTFAPGPGDLLQYLTPTSPLAYNATELYEIISDKMFSMTNSGDSAISNSRANLSPRIPELRFISGGTDVYSGQLFQLTICYNANTVTELHNYRLWFEDTN